MPSFRDHKILSIHKMLRVHRILKVCSMLWIFRIFRICRILIGHWQLHWELLSRT